MRRGRQYLHCRGEIGIALGLVHPWLRIAKLAMEFSCWATRLC
jgi:hypothetical protein